MTTAVTTPNRFGEALDIDLETTADCNCVKCGEPVGEVLAVFKDAIHCDKCIEEYEEKRRLEEIAPFWKKFCPALYQETDVEHKEFVKVWPLLQQHGAKQNLILCGESGTCKSRAMMQRLKLCLYKGMSVGVLWPDVLDEAIETRKTSKLREELVAPTVLGIDDFLTSGSSLENVTKFLKGIIDIRLRDGKTTIITTNLKARDIEQDAAKFDNMTKAEHQRVLAIIRRLRGEYKTIDTDAGLGDGRF